MSFARLVARAAPPPERAGEHAFELVATDSEVLARRHRALTDAFGSAAALDAHAEALGLAPDAWRARFGDARLAGPLPDWACAFEVIFERIDDSQYPFSEFRRWAGAQAAVRWPSSLRRGPDALEGPLDYLAQRLGAALEPVLHVESKLGRRPLPWRERFQRYPALGYALGRIAADWLTDLERIATAAATDLSFLSHEIFGGAKPGALIAIESGLGDPHNGGRSVAILRFEGGRVVYKPKDLRIAAAVGEIAAPFAEAGLVPPRLLVREGYAWEPVYEPRPVADRRDADAFFAALGGWLALLQALGATDFWFDNLIAEGSVPRFIDFETALQPLQPGRASGDEAAARAETSPLGVGILPLLMPTREGEDALDIGCLARPGVHRTPLNRLDDGGAITWHEDRFAPRYAGGAAADAADHFNAFEEGYLRIARTLAVPASWQRVSKVLGRITGAPVRIIPIDTWTCYRMMRQSLAPRHLSDGAWREIALHTMLRQGDGMTDTMDGALREATARDLRRLDVPFFQTPLGSRDLLGADGERQRDVFACEPVAAVQDRLRALARLDEEERRAWLRSGFSLRLGNPPRRRVASVQPSPATTGDLLAWADEIASDVLRLAVTDVHGLPTWLGLHHDVFTGWRIVGPLGFDVLSGRAGVARALLELARLLDRDDLVATACEAAAGAGRAYLDWLAASLTAGAGHAVGAGGLVATLAEIANLRPLAAEVWRAAAAGEVWMYSGGDFASGLDGWRAAAAALGESAPDNHGRERAYAPSALPRLARWLDPDAAVPLCDSARAAARLREDRDRHGSWFAAGWLDDRHNLSSIDGLPALAVAFACLAQRT